MCLGISSAADAGQQAPRLRREERRWVQPRANFQIREDDLHMRPHRVGRHCQLGSDLLAGACRGERLERPLLILVSLSIPGVSSPRLLGLARGSICSEIHYRWGGIEPTKPGMGGQR